MSNGSASAVISVPAAKAAGNYPIQAMYTPGANFGGSSDNTKALMITKATPVITWPTPASITSGTALSATQLNATANTAGTFLYTPPSGTVLPAGNNQPLSVTFTPSDTTDYSNATATVSITVNPVSTTALTAAPSSLTFSTQYVDIPSLPKTVTIKNTGTTAVSFTSISVSGNFLEDNRCPQNLAANASCAVNISFLPKSEGNLTGQLTIASNAGVETVPLSGAGLGIAFITGVAIGAGSQSSTVIYVDVKFTNSGTGVANNVAITQLSAYTVPFAVVNPDSKSQPPIAVGNLAPGASQTVRLYFDQKSLPFLLYLAQPARSRTSTAPTSASRLWNSRSTRRGGSFRK